MDATHMDGIPSDKRYRPGHAWPRGLSALIVPNRPQVAFWRPRSARGPRL